MTDVPGSLSLVFSTSSKQSNNKQYGPIQLHRETSRSPPAVYGKNWGGNPPMFHFFFHFSSFLSMCSNCFDEKNKNGPCPAVRIKTIKKQFRKTRKVWSGKKRKKTEKTIFVYTKTVIAVVIVGPMLLMCVCAY